MSPDGSPSFPEFNLSPLEDYPDIDLLNRDVIDRPGWKARLTGYAQRFASG